MIQKKHNDASKEFLQKLLMYIDTSLVSASAADSSNVIGVLVNSITNIKDAILSEVIRDSFAEEINNTILQEKDRKKKLEENLEKEKSLEKQEE
jgi:nucleoside diphosphate kinase